MSPSTTSTVCRRSSAWTSMSTALPPMPAEPRCMRMRACGSANRLPLVPAESRNCPALQASPSASVETSHGTSRMMSRMASIEGTEPPGGLIHRAASEAEAAAAGAGGVVGGALGGQCEQLRHQQRAVVVVEHPVEHQDPPQQQLLPGPLAELRNLVFVSHGPSLRQDQPGRRRTLPSADLLTAARPGGSPE